MIPDGMRMAVGGGGWVGCGWSSSKKGAVAVLGAVLETSWRRQPLNFEGWGGSRSLMRPEISWIVRAMWSTSERTS